MLAAVAAAAEGAPRAPTIRAVAASHARIFLTVGIGALLVSAVRASRQAVMPLWADHLGLDAATTSLIYGLAGGIDMLVFYPGRQGDGPQGPRLGRGAVDADHGRRRCSACRSRTAPRRC